jgi:hypothetical protein
VSDNGLAFSRKRSCEQFVLYESPQGAHDVVRLHQRGIQRVRQLEFGLTDGFSCKEAASGEASV